jgi:16S rRNA (guanine527-N7)-methyltransferase
MNGYPANWEGQLATGLEQMNLDIGQPQRQGLLSYLALLMKWNQAYNLTAIRDPDEMVPRQLLDSLSILPLIRGTRILDVGTGAGLPGIPLAICMPEAGFTLIDSNGKKTRFVQQVKMELGLGNIEVLQTRVEQLDRANSFDTITSRAFAALPKMVGLTQRLLADGGILLAMKGSIPRQEIEAVQAGGATVEVVELTLPLSGERHALIVRLSG